MTPPVDLPISFLSPGLDTGLVSVTDGVRPLDEEGTAFVPRGPWRSVDGSDPALVSPAPTRPAESVAVLDLGPALLEEGRRVLLPLLGGTTMDGTGALRRFQAAVLEALYERHGLTPETVGAADLVAHGPGQDSTAYNEKTGAYMGLHIDSHQRLAFGERHQAMTLCAVNLGQRERYLNLVPRTVAAIVDDLADRGVDIPTSALALKNAYLHAVPDQIVVRLALPPGSAYLCITQNAIHDGATAPGDQPDVAFLTMSRLADDVARVAAA
jgi:hypothetical protein